MFLVEGASLDADALESQLEPLGDSLLVVGTSDLLKVHVHTDDPGAALSLGVRLGTIESVEIANMHEQSAQREERLGGGEGQLADIPTLETALVVVAPGRGTRRLFEELGATRVVEGGQTMNPSTGDIAAAIEAAPAETVIVLPNNKNVILSAEHAVALSDGKTVLVIPTRTVQEGLRAAFEYEAEGSADANVERMTEAIAPLRTGEITTASRTVSLDGVAVSEGEYLGLVDGQAVVSAAGLDDAVAGRGCGAAPRRSVGAHGSRRGGRPGRGSAARAPRPATSVRRRRGARGRPASLSAAALVGALSTPVRVVIVEDNEVFRSSLELLLGMQPGIEIVGLAETARAAVGLVAELRPDVVVVDFRLPDSDGVATTTALRSLEPTPAVICLTAEATAEEGDAVIAAGAAALVEKGVPIAELASVIRSVV